MTWPRRTLPYEVAAIYYPSLRHAPWWLRFALPLLLTMTVLGAGLLTSPPGSVDFFFGVVIASGSTLSLGCFALLYLPIATWLRIGEAGITYSVGFCHRALPWDRVREVRLVSMDRMVLPEVVVEVIPDAHEANRLSRRWLVLGSWRIDANLFGWSADALAEEMDGWRARNVAP